MKRKFRDPRISGLQDFLNIFACGSDIKNRFSIYKDNKFYFSEDNGNLDNPDNFFKYINSIKKMSADLDFSPDVVVCDKHPMYFSSKVDNIFKNVKKIFVQHHHAHIASFLYNSNISAPVIGIAFDGTGYGDDGNLWGGEFLIVAPENFSRFSHLEYLKIPGGDIAVKEPWRLAFALLYDCLGDDIFKYDFDFLKLRKRSDYVFVKKMIDKNVNIALSSSAGRLFDAVSSLLGLTHIVNFEAEAAINLEKAALLSNISEKYVFSHKPLVKGIINDLKSKISVSDIARKFHNSLAFYILDTAKLIREKYKLNDVILSGGVFQNRLLYNMACGLLMDAGFNLIQDNSVPVTDLGICVGQTQVVLK